jgi:hypothetical protein
VQILEFLKDIVRESVVHEQLSQVPDHWEQLLSHRWPPILFAVSCGDAPGIIDITEVVIVIEEYFSRRNGTRRPCCPCFLEVDDGLGVNTRRAADATFGGRLLGIADKGPGSLGNAPFGGLFVDEREQLDLRLTKVVDVDGALEFGPSVIPDAEVLVEGSGIPSFFPVVTDAIRL